MSIIRGTEAPVTETPNAAMKTLASPARLGSALAVWQVTLQSGGSGPEHTMDADQVYVVLSGELTVTIAGADVTGSAGDAVFIPAGSPRRIATLGGEPVVALVAMPAGAHVSTPSGSHHGELPWAV